MYLILALLGQFGLDCFNKLAQSSRFTDFTNVSNSGVPSRNPLKLYWTRR